MSLGGRHMVVTGGGTGVGLACALALRKAGATVTVMGRRAGPLEETGMPFQTCDVTDPESVANAIGAARSETGPVAGVIANAGAAESVPFHRMSPGTLQSMLSVNLGGVVNVWQAVLSDMKNAGWGRLVAVASTAGLKGYPYVSAYCAAKHGVVGLTRALALELAETGITVNAVCPGFVDTPLLDRSVATIREKTGLSEDEARMRLARNNPQKRLIDPSEVAEAAVWLCTDAAGAVSGHALSISGGEV